MIIAAALCWYDETTDFLERCIRSLDGVADVLVTADGAWTNFEGGTARSPAEQRAALGDTARAIGLPHHELQLEDEALDGIWPSQVAKRALLYEATLEETRPDWLFVIDGDEYVGDFDPGLREILGTLEQDVATVLLRQVGGHLRFRERPARRFYRALPGLTVLETHNGVVVPTSDGVRWLNGPGRRIRREPFADLRSALTLNHEALGRPRQRVARSLRYYETRARERVEVFS